MSNKDLQKAYDSVAEHFSLTRQKALQAELIYFKRYLTDGQQVLDLGCGTGRMIRVLKDFEIDLTAVDISAEQLNYARKEETGKIKKINFIQDDILNLDFPSNSFDLIFCIATFHHLKNKKARLELLEKMKTWLKPKGYLLMTNWNLNQKAYSKYRNIWKGAGNFMVPYKDNDGQVLANRFYHSFKIKELNQLLKKVGFQNEKLEFSENKNNLISASRKI